MIIPAGRPGIPHALFWVARRCRAAGATLRLFTRSVTSWMIEHSPQTLAAPVTGIGYKGTAGGLPI